MNDLEDNLKPNTNEGIAFYQLSICMLCMLFYADDAVLFSDSAEGLQDLINKLEVNVTPEERDDFLQDIYKLENKEFIQLSNSMATNDRILQNLDNEIKGAIKEITTNPEPNETSAASVLFPNKCESSPFARDCSAINTPEIESFFTMDAGGEYAYMSTAQDSYGESDIVRIKLLEKEK